MPERVSLQYTHAPPSVPAPFSKIFISKMLSQSKPNFMKSLYGKGERNLYKWFKSHDQDGRHAHIWSKPSKTFFSRTQCLVILKLGMHHRELKFYKIYINDDPSLTLTYFMARSNLVAHAFKWGNLLQRHLMGQTCSRWPK